MRRWGKYSVLVGMYLLLIPGAWSFQFYNIDTGVSQRGWSAKEKAPLDEIIFAWFPTLPFGSALYFLRATCDQYDQNGDLAGNNNAKFDDIVVLGVDSENSLGATPGKSKIKQGIGKPVVWDLTPHAAKFAADSAVLVGGTAKVTRKVPQFGEIWCELSVWEIYDLASLASATEEERLRYFEVELESGDALLRGTTRRRLQAEFDAALELSSPEVAGRGRLSTAERAERARRVLRDRKR